jgi:precorrin-8X/cobalt-precorrin-8 methylmutase
MQTVSVDMTTGLMQRWALLPDEIYRRSFAIVDALLPPGDWTQAERQVIRRIVHATGDPHLASLVRFTPGAPDAGVTALMRGAPIFTDMHMVAAGINSEMVRAVGSSIHVLIAQEGLEAAAQATGTTRSAAAIEAALSQLTGALVVIGNAPTALLALLDALDTRRCLPPALIVGMPVGFVATPESKDALLERPYPAITIVGTRGGSPAAAATVNALLALAQEKSNERDQ